MKHAIAEAKQRLPLPQLLAKIGDGAHAKKSTRCPFHEDGTSSFSVFQNGTGAWFWKCHTGCGTGDGVNYLEKRFSLSTRDAIARYCHEAGLNIPPKSEPKAKKIFDWQACLDNFADDAARKLADWRGFSPEFVDWLHARRIVGSYLGKTAFANHNAGKVVSCHFRLANGKWKFEPTGKRTHPLVFGDTRQAGYVLCFESQWDAFAVMDKLGWHTANGLPDKAVFITRGSSNGKLICGRLTADAVCYAFTQNDEPAQTWLRDVAKDAGCKVLNVTTPAPHKDANDWTRAGATKEDIEAAMKNAKLVDVRKAEPADIPDRSGNFDKLTSWIRGEIVGLLLDEEMPMPTKRSRIAKKAVEALERMGRFYFHADLRDFDSAMFFDANRKRLERVRSDAFGAWLSEWLNVNRADTLFRFVLAEVETAALCGAHTTAIIPESFWAARPGALFLSNGDGGAVKIASDGVHLVDNGSDGVLFTCGKTLAPWKMTSPKDPFATCRIFRNTHCAAVHGPDLLRLWIYSLPANPRSKPPLCFAGGIGSGKTRTVKAISELYGLPFVAQKVEDEAETNFWPSIDQGGLYTLDNADTKCRWLADALANAATDGCSQRRKLYTNAETVVLRARAWLCVTTANPTFASDAGLADRLLVVRMERRDDETSDAALTDEILTTRDAGLSHVAVTLQKALADIAPTPAKLNARHPDFAAFAVKIGRALGREAETVAALKAAEADKSSFCLENDPIGAALLAYMREARTFTGTAAELAPKLCEVDADLKDRLSAKRLGKRLSMLWPHLQKSLATARKESDRNHFTIFTFKSAEFAEFQTGFP